MANKDRGVEKKKPAAAKGEKETKEAPKKKTTGGRKGAHAPVVRVCKSCHDVPHHQDRLYGVGQRLHTVGEAKSTCTRCGVVTK